MKLSKRHASFALFSLFLLLLSAELIQTLVHFALDLGNTASHIVVIPFISIALIWLNRKNIFHNVRSAVIPGTIVAALGCALWVVAKRATGTGINENDHLALQTFSLVILWLGAFLLFYGSAAFRVALFPLLFLFLATPIPSALLDKTIAILRSGSAEAAFGLLRLAGLPVYRKGFVFILPDLVVEVAPECSGIRSGIALLIASLLAGHIFLSSASKRALLLTAAVPILLFKNGLRIAVLSFLAVRYDTRILTSALHREGGIPFFFLGLFLIYPVLKMLVNSERPKSAASSEAPSLSAQHGGFQ